MNAMLLLLTALQGQPVLFVSNHVPKLNVEATCKASSAEDVVQRLSEPESFANCMRDESTAEQQLNDVWTTTPVAIRDRCHGEAVAGGNDSYVDLLICIQMTGWATPQSPDHPLKGASKKQSTKQP